ncbi:MAG: hypothetical protein R6W70_08595 [bacterium]
MSHKIKKISKIIDEVTTYFLYRYNCEIEIKIRPGKDAFYIKFFFKKLILDKKEIEELNDLMKKGRDPSLTSYYWQLTGEVENNSELSLIGMMCDDVSIDQTEDGLRLNLVRNIKSGE